MKIAILGAGWLGCHLAKHLIQTQQFNQHKIKIYEKEDHIFSGSSSKNQNRHHLGFHYARSYQTRKLCEKYFKRFQQEYQFGLHNIDRCHYLISKDSVLDQETYLSIFEQEKYTYKILNQHNPTPTNPTETNTTSDTYQHIDCLLEVPEQYINHKTIRTYFEELLQPYLHLNHPITTSNLIFDQKKDQWILNGEEYDLIIDTTNYGLDYSSNSNIHNPDTQNTPNPDFEDFYTETTVSFLYQSNLDYSLGITVVDGNFPSLYPYDIENKIYTLNHVTYTPLKTNPDQTPDQNPDLDQIRQQMEESIQTYYPNFLENFTHHGHFFSKKVKKHSGCDWRGLYGEKHKNLINLVTTKIIGIYDAEKYLDEIIENMTTENKIALVGSTGFVGSNLLRQMKFTHLYNSKNINTIRNQSFKRITFSGLPATKWQINQKPDQDLANIQQIQDHLKTVTAEEFILISTIDVYPPNLQHPNQPINEDTPIQPEDHQQAYGKHHLMFEEFIQSLTPQKFKSSLILRLPGLFGLGLKKNIIFDLLLKRTDYPINPESEFQWYDLSYLAEDIHKETQQTHQPNQQNQPNQSTRIVNLFSQPVKTQLILDRFFNNQEIKTTFDRLQKYDYQTKHSSFPYYCDVETIINRLELFINLSKKFRTLKITDPSLEAKYHFTTDLNNKNTPNNPHLVVSNLAWNQEDEEFVLQLLKSYGITHLEIAPAKVFGSNIDLNFHQMLDYRQKLNKAGFNVYSLQAVLYQVPDTELFKSKYTQSRFIHQIKEAINAAKVLGAKRIVIGGPKNRKLHDNTYQECQEQAIQVFTELANYAQQTDPDIILVLEPNPEFYGCEFANTSQLALDLVNQVNHPNFQLHLDTACLHLANEPVLKAYQSEENQQKLKHIHISATKLKPICEETEINYPEILSYLNHMYAESSGNIKISLEMVNSSLAKLNRSLQILLS